MIYCESPTLEHWIAPPQDDFPRPRWTKLIANGRLLSNSLEYASWDANPVELLVCEGCWHSGCSQQGLARIVRLAEHLLWLPPRARDFNLSLQGFLNESNFIQEAVLMPLTTWEALRETAHNLPRADSYARANREDIGAIWLREMPAEIRQVDLTDIDAGLRRALASDPLDIPPAREAVRSLIGWILENPKKAVEGRIMRVEACGSAVNTFYFDGYEWSSFLVGREKRLCYGADWVYVDDAGTGF